MTLPADPTAPPPADVEGIGFEEAYKRLEAAVRSLEDDGLSLDDALRLYEDGAALADRCAALLEGARLRLNRLTPGGAEVALE